MVAIIDDFNGSKAYVSHGWVVIKNIKEGRTGWRQNGTCYFIGDNKFDLIKKLTKENDPEYFI